MTRTKLVLLRGQAFPSFKLQWLEEASVKPQLALEPSRDGAIEELQCQKHTVTTRSWGQAGHWREFSTRSTGSAFWEFILSGVGTLGKQTVSRPNVTQGRKARCWQNVSPTKG